MQTDSSSGLELAYECQSGRSRTGTNRRWTSSSDLYSRWPLTASSTTGTIGERHNGGQSTGRALQTSVPRRVDGTGAISKKSEEVEQPCLAFNTDGCEVLSGPVTGEPSLTQIPKQVTVIRKHIE